MTFRSAPHSVLPITFSVQGLQSLFVNIFDMGNKDNPLEIWSPPQPESEFCPEKAVDLNGDLFFGRYASLCLCESKAIVSCPLLKFIQTKLQLTFDYTHVGRSEANLKIIDI